jgi:hypothetical protein
MSSVVFLKIVSPFATLCKEFFLAPQLSFIPYSFSRVSVDPRFRPWTFSILYQTEDGLAARMTALFECRFLKNYRVISLFCVKSLSVSMKPTVSFGDNFLRVLFF